MSADTLVRLMDMTAGALAEGEMPADPFEAADVLAAAQRLGGAVVAYATAVRAHRVANAAVWAAYERAELDKTGATPPAPPPPPDPEPDPKPDPPPEPEPGT